MTIETRTEDRKAMAKALAAELGTEARYMGMPTCAYRVGPYTVNKDGSINGDDFEPIRSFLIREGLIEESAAAAPETEEDPVIEALAEGLSHVPSIDSIHENRGGEDTVTSMSVSIPTDGYAPQALINLLRTFFSRQKLLNAMMKGGAIHIDQELVDRLAEEKPDTAERIQEILRNEIDAGLCEGIHLEDGKLTVDFPFDESDPTAWTAYSKVIIAMADRAKTQRNASAAPLSPEDSEMKYFCRSWLIQLGFGGPEHKEDRRVLLGHLHGFAAFRTADKMDAHKAKLAAKRGTRRVEDIVPEVTVHDPD